MKAVYLPGHQILTDKQRGEYAGCRFENAEVFAGVVAGVDSAVVIGDYPDIAAELKERKIPFNVIGGEKSKAPAKKTEPKQPE